MEETKKCSVSRKCGGCTYSGISYEEQLSKKDRYIHKLLSAYGKVNRIIGMEDPYYYRNKVHHVFAFDRKRGIISGCYEANTHRVVDITSCLIEDVKCFEIIETVKKLCVSFKMKTYDEDTGYGFLRHVLVRRGFSTGEIMVVLITGYSQFPGKNNFVKALLKEHPDITTVIQNINDRKTSMVLSDRENVLYGPGFIKDRLCGKTFRISSGSFYQVNPVQTEILYDTAISFAELKGNETVIDAYCGIGTIGLCASSKSARVIGVELNPDAVRDARTNAKENNVKNAEFYKGDAGEFMTAMAEAGEKCDVVFMDPPRSGSTEKFMASCIRLSPERIVYVSCGPETLARDLKYFTAHGYEVVKIQPVDMFPFTEHVETVCLLVRENITFSLPTDSIPSHKGGHRCWNNG